jgi:Domain of unknown function (DUF6249)
MRREEMNMPDNMIGFAAVVLICGFPIAAIWAWAQYRTRKLRTEERLAAIARGLNVSLEPDLPHPAASRRSGILLVAAAVGYSLTFLLLGKWEPDSAEAAVFGIIPFAIGVGFFIDSYLVRRELRSSH